MKSMYKVLCRSVVLIGQFEFKYKLLWISSNPFNTSSTIGHHSLFTQYLDASILCTCRYIIPTTRYELLVASLTRRDHSM